MTNDNRVLPGVGDVEAALAPRREWEGAAIVAGKHIGGVVRAGLTMRQCSIAAHCQGNVAMPQLALEDGVIAVGKTETIAITFLDGSSLQAAIIMI